MYEVNLVNKTMENVIISFEVINSSDCVKTLSKLSVVVKELLSFVRNIKNYQFSINDDYIAQLYGWMKVFKQLQGSIIYVDINKTLNSNHYKATHDYAVKLGLLSEITQTIERFLLHAKGERK